MYNLVIHVTSSLASMLLVFTLAGVVLFPVCLWCETWRQLQTKIPDLPAGSGNGLNRSFLVGKKPVYTCFFLEEKRISSTYFQPLLHLFKHRWCSTVKAVFFCTRNWPFDRNKWGKVWFTVLQRTVARFTGNLHVFMCIWRQTLILVSHHLYSILKGTHSLDWCLSSV